jgi:hypothetical protein
VPICFRSNIFQHERTHTHTLSLSHTHTHSLSHTLSHTRDRGCVHIHNSHHLPGNTITNLLWKTNNFLLFYRFVRMMYDSGSSTSDLTSLMHTPSCIHGCNIVYHTISISNFVVQVRDCKVINMYTNLFIKCHEAATWDHTYMHVHTMYHTRLETEWSMTWHLTIDVNHHACLMWHNAINCLKSVKKMMETHIHIFLHMISGKASEYVPCLVH